MCSTRQHSCDEIAIHAPKLKCFEVFYKYLPYIMAVVSLTFDWSKFICGMAAWGLLHRWTAFEFSTDLNCHVGYMNILCHVLIHWLTEFRCCLLGDQWWSSWWPAAQGHNSFKTLQFWPNLCLSNLCRRVSFPMGSYGAPTMKFTVSHSWISYKHAFHFWKWITLNGESACIQHMLIQFVGLAQLRVWGTLPCLSSLRLPLDVKQLRLALKRPGVNDVSLHL